MPEFYYKAVTRDGQPDEGQMSGDSVAAIIARLQDNGRIPIVTEEIRAGRARQRPAARRPLRLGRNHADVGAFTQSLAALVGSSVPLDRALQIMLDAEQDPKTLKLVEDVQSSVRGGNSLSKALEEQEAAFTPFHISMVRAAEASGTLSDGLERLAEYLERSRALRDKVLSALIYPGILAAVAGISVLILLVYVVPQFRDIFDEMGGALPLPTRITLAVSDFMAAYGWLIMAGIVAAGLGLKQLWRRAAFRMWLDGLLLRLRVVGPLLQAIDTARFSRSLGTLLSNGVPMLSSLPIARDTMANRVMKTAVGSATDELRDGGELSTTLQAAAVFPSLAIQLMKVGEESGAIDRMMLRLSDAYDREVETKIRRLLALLEPALIIGLGLAIAGIIMSVLAGIISINDIPG